MYKRQGCTQCAGLCPAVFQMEGTLAVAQPGPIPPEEVPQAVEMCIRDSLKNYLAAFPKVSGYMDKTIADAKACGYVSTLFGRRRALPELASSNFNVRSSGERMARNTPIQGLSLIHI